MSRFLIVPLLLLSPIPTLAGSEAGDPSALSKLPVREITVFKDGHAFVLHSGRVATETDGSVRIDELPAPVLGTFWPYSGDRSVKLTSVTAAQQKVSVSHPAVTIAELLEANPGVEVEIVQTNGTRYSAQIVGTPKRPAEAPPSPAPAAPNLGSNYGYYGGYGYSGNRESAAPRDPYPTTKPAEKPVTVLLRTKEGTSAVPLNLIQKVTFKGDFKRELKADEFRNQLSLKLEWSGGRAGRVAEAGVFYLQKGIRWVPSYKISLDGKGTATVKLQATLLNELVDFEDATVHLVVGVPTFFFKDFPDPISLQQSFPALSKYFQPNSQTAYAFSNAIMGQGGFGGGGFGGGGGLGGSGGRCGGEPDEQQQPADNLIADKNEDLYLFSLKHVSLKRGASAAIPVAEYRLKYRDIYSVEVPFAPPPEVERNQNRQQEAEIAKLLKEPRAQHKIRLINTAGQPLTTAPTLIVSGDRVVAQSLMPYAAPGGETDLTVTTSGDIKIVKSEKEAARKPGDIEDRGYSYSRIDIDGKLTATSYHDQPMDLEVIRYIPGNVDKTNPPATLEVVNPFDSDLYVRRDEAYGWWSWWNYYSWPYWWDRYNHVTRVTWKVRLEPKQSLEFS